MDGHDMSVALNFVRDMMLKKEMMIVAAQEEKNQPLTWTETRDELLQRYQDNRMNTMNQDLPIRQAFVPPAYPPCTRPFSALTKIMLKDLRLETHHKGQYLILKSIAPPSRLISVVSIVEDEHGDAIMLTMRHQDETCSLDEILGEGMILAVKEPYLRRMSDGTHEIIIDHVSNYKYLSRKDSLTPELWQEKIPEGQDNAATWLSAGNEFLDKEIYSSAVCSYTEGLGCSPTEKDLYALKLNRSVAYFMSYQFESALLDIEFVEQMSEPDDDVLLGKARVLYEMQKFREYSDTCKRLALEDPKNEQWKKKLQQGIDRLIEKNTGRYQFLKLHDEATKLCPPILDHATYIGPVAVKSAGHRGRGLFTTKEVKTGDLLLCEKASGYAFVDELDPNSRKTILINAQQGTAMMGTQVELATVMIQKLRKSPSSIPGITDLHHGSYEAVDASLVDDAPVIDSFLVEQIISFNIFSCPVTTYDHWLGTTTNNNNSDPKFGSCGVWKMASYINHSCNINAQRSFIGDMIIVRATRDLAPDTEVVFGYAMPSADGYDELERKFQHYGFQCDCAICHDCRNTSKETRLKRSRLMTEASNAIERLVISRPAKVEGIVKKLAASYNRSALEVPRLGLWEIQFDLVQKYFGCYEYNKVVEWGLKGLESLGYVIHGGEIPCESGTTLKVTQWGLMMPPVLRCWVILSRSYRLVAPELEGQAKAYAKLTYRVCIGEDETFDKAYRDFLL